MGDKGFLPLDDLSPRRLSRQLREGKGAHLSERRIVLVASLVGMGCMGLISLYQAGVIRHLPDLPGRWFDADKVDASDEAYGILSTPDAPLGLVSYATTALLATIGGRDRARRRPVLSLLLAGKATADALQAAKLSRDQWVKHRAFCIWCLIATGATFAALVPALREGRAAARTLAGR